MSHKEMLRKIMKNVQYRYDTYIIFIDYLAW